MPSQASRRVLSADLLASMASALVAWPVTNDIGCRCYVITGFCAVIYLQFWLHFIVGGTVS